MIQEIIFGRGTPVSAVRDSLVRRFDIPADGVFIGTSDELNRDLGNGMEYPLVVIHDEMWPGEFPCSFESGSGFFEATGGLGELVLATMLCKELKTRALVDDGGLLDSCYLLVTPDGWHGRVLLDGDALDENELKLNCALQPIPSAPEVPVVDQQGYDRGWYRDGKVPEAGYAFPEDEPEPRPESDG